MDFLLGVGQHWPFVCLGMINIIYMNTSFLLRCHVGEPNEADEELEQQSYLLVRRIYLLCSGDCVQWRAQLGAIQAEWGQGTRKGGTEAGFESGNAAGTRGQEPPEGSICLESVFKTEVRIISSCCLLLLIPPCGQSRAQPTPVKGSKKQNPVSDHSFSNETNVAHSYMSMYITVKTHKLLMFWEVRIPTVYMMYLNDCGRKTKRLQRYISYNNHPDGGMLEGIIWLIPSGMNVL